MKKSIGTRILDAYSLFFFAAIVVVSSLLLVLTVPLWLPFYRLYREEALDIESEHELFL